MPSAVRQNQELAKDGLVSILVEVQGSNEAQLEHFLWQRFPENECFSCVGVGVPIPPSRGIPNGAVVGVDGTLLWSGNPAAEKQTIERLVDEQLKLMRKGWGDSADARKVRAALFGRDDIAAAVALVAAMADGDEKAALQQEVEARYGAKKRAVEALKQQGAWLAAEEAAKALGRSVGDHAAWAPEAAALVAGFETDEAMAELAADRALEKVVKALRKGDLDKAPKNLEKFLEKHGQTSVGKRASRMLTALRTPLR